MEQDMILKNLAMVQKYQGLQIDEKGELTKVISLSQPPCKVLEMDNDEMEIIIECPNCHKPTKVGATRMISGHVGCDNEIEPGKICYWDDLQPRILESYKNQKTPLIYDEYEQYEVDKERSEKVVKLWKGIAYRNVFRFENKWGAVVVKNESCTHYDDDLFDMAVMYDGYLMNNLKVKSSKKKDETVIGGLTNEEVMEILGQIKEFEK